MLERIIELTAETLGANAAEMIFMQTLLISLNWQWHSRKNSL